jgi:hypothetical protein
VVGFYLDVHCGSDPGGAKTIDANGGRAIRNLCGRALFGSDGFGNDHGACGEASGCQNFTTRLHGFILSNQANYVTFGRNHSDIASARFDLPVFLC